MTNFAGDPDRFMAARRHEFDVNVRSYGQICHAEQAHSALAQIYAERIHVSGWR
jgi:hypothetical protein